MKAIIGVACLVALAACNTMEGVGEDLRSAGTAIERTASGNNPQKQPPRRDDERYNQGY